MQLQLRCAQRWIHYQCCEHSAFVAAGINPLIQALIDGMALFFEKHLLKLRAAQPRFNLIAIQVDALFAQAVIAGVGA